MTAPATWRELGPREKEAAVLPLVKRGLSASRIADALQVDSRNSIITVIGRLQKSKQLPPPRKQVARTKAPAKPKPKPSERTVGLANWTARSGVHPNDFKGRAEQRAASPGIAVISRAAAFDPLPGVAPVRLVDHQEHQCRWPVDVETDEPGHFFCGAECGITETYCRSHASLGSNGLPVRRKQTPAYA